MKWTLTTVTGPTSDPVTLEEAKLWTRIDGSDENALIATLITAATQSAEQYLRRSLISQTLKLSVDLESSECELGDGVYDLPVSVLYGGLPKVIELPMQPVISISSVVTYDTSNTNTTFSSSYYTLSNGRLTLNYGSSWPSNMRQYGACEITYVAGFGSTSSSVPQPIKSAIMMHVKQMYDNRDDCELSPGTINLLRQYRIMGR